MAVKRRIIWMSDEEWSTMTKIAKDRGETISGVIRQFWHADSQRPRDTFGSPRPAPKPGKG